MAVPVVTAIVGVIAVLFQDWRKYRTQVGQRRLALEGTRLQVSFVTEWWNAEKLISVSPQRLDNLNRLAALWLTEASERVAVLANAPTPLADSRAAEGPGTSRVTVRRLLLLYRLHGWVAKTIRVIFFISLALLLLEETSISYDSADLIGSDVGASIFLAVTTLALRFWAASADSSMKMPQVLTRRPGKAVGQQRRQRRQ
jgi:hypothetical protein